MNKLFLTLLAFCVWDIASAQIKIGDNPTSVGASSSLELESTNKALVITRVANTAAITSPVNGMIIYDLSSNCVKFYENDAWSACISYGTSSLITSILTQIGNEGDSPNTVSSVVTASQLSSISVTGVTPTNESAYQAYIDANPNNFSAPATISEVQAMVTAVNAAVTPVLTQIGNEGDSPNTVPSVVTTTQLTSLGVTGVTAAYESAYQAYIDANPNNFSAPATIAEVQAMVTAVNAFTTSNGTALISAYSCSTASAGTMIAGTPVSGVTQTITATVTTVGTYNIQAVANGVTFAATGTFAGIGAQNIVLTATGTPTSDGTNSFTLNTTPGCSFSRTTAPAPITIPATITLAQNRTYIVASVFDQDYLPYTAPTGAATTNTQAANGVNEAVTVNVQGSITTAGVNIKIPVTATGSNTLPAYSTTITIPSSMTEDGISRDLTLSWAAQAYTSGTTTINATIAAVGGTLNAKKLDINAGIGNDALGVLMGQFTYPYNNAGNTTTYSVRNIAGIPDKMFGLPDNNSNSTTHMMLYLPTVAEDGNIWLNNNLGAHYANINHASFNPAQQATGATDHLAYGSLFQWGRKPDGHELITYTGGTTGTVVNGTTSTNSDAPADALFILEPNSPYDWRSSQSDTLWATEASANNPCPVGFRVPTVTEQNTLVSAASITNSLTAASSTLKFTVPGYRNYSNGTLYNVGSNGLYWSSSVSGTSASSRSFDSGGTYIRNDLRAFGFTVRCLKD